MGLGDGLSFGLGRAIRNLTPYIRGMVVVLLSHVKTATPQLYEGVKNLGKISALAVMSLAGCGFALFMMYGGKQSYSDYWPLGIAIVFAWVAAFCLRVIWKDWRAWKEYGRLHRGKPKR